jgi:hypothetical protein
LFTSVNSLNSFTQSQAALNGQFATTGSNTFTGNQVIDRANKLYTNGIYWTDVTAGFNNLEIINQGGGNLDFASLNGGKVRFVSSSVNFLNSPISSSNDISTSANIYAANLTGSTIPAGTISSSAQITSLGFVSSSVTASSLVTASFDNGTRNLTFTKGDASTFNVNIPDVSGSTGNFATTGSNIFNGIQTLRSTGSTPLIVDHNDASPTQNTFMGIFKSGSAEWLVGNLGTDDSFVLYNPNTFQTPLAIRQDNGLTLLGTLTASLQEGYVWAGGVGNVSKLVATSSFGGGSTINTGSFATTGSNTFVGNQTISTAGNSQLTLIAQPGFQTNVEFQSENSNFQAYGDFRINNNGQFGGSGSIKFTTSNNFTEIAADGGIKIGATNGGGNGIDAGNISMQVRSGSLSLAPAGFSNTTASLLHLSSSSNTNNVNLMFKNSTAAADTIISGSNNIFTNPAAPTAGFKRFVGNNHNIELNASAVPQVSGSMGSYVSLSNNYIGGTGGILMRGPVSSSAWSIVNNLINPTTNYLIGSTVSFHAEKIVSGLTIANNVGNVFPSIQAYKTPLSSSFTYSTNQGAGIVNLLLHSSSINYSGNQSFGGTTINNSYFPLTSSIVAADGFVTVQSNAFIGTTNINFSGSFTTFGTSPRQITNSILVGYNSASLVLNGDSSNMIATSMFGAGLSATGSNSKLTAVAAPYNDYGSVFVGRNNAQDGNRNKTAETVFAVGTGTTGSLKTGFLIDSGSNVFVEGTLNISGSTTMTGSLILSSSNATELTVIGNSQITGGLAITGSGIFGYALVIDGNTRSNNTISTKGFQLSGSATTEAINSNYQNTLWQHAGNVFFGNQLAGVGSGSLNFIAAGGGNMNISSSNLNVSAGDLTQTGNLTALGQYSNITIASNLQGTGSQYPGNTVIVAPELYPTDIYGGFSINNSGNATTLLGVVVNSYSSQYGGTPTPMINAYGNNPGGNDSGLAFISDGRMDVWKQSNFKYGVNVTGSVSISETMKLKPQNPLPSGTIGDLAVSGSSLYFYNGAWTLIV